MHFRWQLLRFLPAVVERTVVNRQIQKDSAATFEEKKEGDTFTVGFDQDFPPMGFVGDDGEYTGFDLELAKEVCDRNGWKFNRNRLPGILKMHF